MKDECSVSEFLPRMTNVLKHTPLHTLNTIALVMYHQPYIYSVVATSKLTSFVRKKCVLCMLFEKFLFVPNEDNILKCIYIVDKICYNFLNKISDK